MGFIKKNNSHKKIPLAIQKQFLKKDYPNSIVKRNKEHSLEWLGTLKPTPLSKEYTVLVQLKSKLEVFVLVPNKLDLHKDEQELPHTYSTPRQKLCLFYGNREWNRSFLISDTIIPWASEWLYYYELWLITGDWLGGGIEHNEEKNDEK